MTITYDNWCLTCQEACHDHASICTVCGSALSPPPPTTSSRNNNIAGVRAIPEFMTDDLRNAGLDLRNMLSGLQGQVRNLDAATRGALVNNNNNNAWQTIPAEALDPQAATSTAQPTSKETLKNIPRIILKKNSSIFHEVTLNIRSKSGVSFPQFQAIRGEFGQGGDFKFPDSSLVVGLPLTGKGGLSEETKSKLRASQNSIIYMERGDGVTFVQKAMLAQDAGGASAVVIGNNMSTPWPYVMNDSKNEAETCGLKIPVVMVKQSDGQQIVDRCKAEEITCNLSIRTHSRDCVVCRDALEVSQTVLQLPGCGHIFHDTCALLWLTKQNSCPYCRFELPTDDPEYENERRRTQRTHAGSDTSANHSNWNAFYG
jgi:hypothetical protein